MTEKLSKDLLESLKRKLEEKKKDLVNAKKLLNEEDSYRDPDRTIGNAEFEEEAEEDRSHYETLLEEQNTDKTLELVDKALNKFRVGTYGVCEKCGNQIDLKRLEAVPEADMCKVHAG